MSLKRYEFWFVTGSQHLYGDEVLKKVAEHSKEMAAFLDGAVCGKVLYKGVVTTPDEVTAVLKQANSDDACAGVITWMHTFSPSKMWINGLKNLTKPFLHLHTQYNQMLPYDTIDMDFMNLNQSAHGDKEHGFITARLRMPRKVVVGFWQDKPVLDKIGNWMRSAIGVKESGKLRVVRFADNMRQVAVTEGDKVEAEIVLGWSVNSLAMGDLVAAMEKVSDADVDKLFEEFKKLYDIQSGNIGSIKYQIKTELAIKDICEKNGFGAFVTCFENLYGVEQLPGLACQRLMGQGYGFGAEGDWKTAALLRVIKAMEEGLPGGSSFMEDYTYHLEEGKELALGAHMLEIDPSIAAGKIRIDVQPLGIGGKADPARMVFDGKAGKATLSSLVDMGGRMRLIVADVEAVAPVKDMPKLPVARVMWKPLPDFKTGVEAWILAGGAHHNVMSYSASAEMLRDFAEMVGIEFVHIGEKTDIEAFKKELAFNDLLWKMKRD